MKKIITSLLICFTAMSASALTESERRQRLLSESAASKTVQPVRGMEAPNSSLPSNTVPGVSQRSNTNDCDSACASGTSGGYLNLQPGTTTVIQAGSRITTTSTIEYKYESCPAGMTSPQGNPFRAESRRVVQRYNNGVLVDTIYDPWVRAPNVACFTGVEYRYVNCPPGYTGQIRQSRSGTGMDTTVEYTPWVEIQNTCVYVPPEPITYNYGASGQYCVQSTRADNEWTGSICLDMRWTESADCPAGSARNNYPISVIMKANVIWKNIPGAYVDSVSYTYYYDPSPVLCGFP